MRYRALAVVLLLAISLEVVGCATSSTPSLSPIAQSPLPAIANPASENCIRQGGTLAIRKRGDGGEYGVCVFAEGMECEEWALWRGECPVGGVKVTDFVTPAAQYCAITGGAYAVTSNAGMENEQGTCTFPDGKVCDVWDYFNGMCDRGP